MMTRTIDDPLASGSWIVGFSGDSIWFTGSACVPPHASTSTTCDTNVEPPAASSSSAVAPPRLPPVSIDSWSLDSDVGASSWIGCGATVYDGAGFQYALGWT